MEGHPLGPGGEDITWPDQVAPRGRKACSTRKINPQTSDCITDRRPATGPYAQQVHYTQQVLHSFHPSNQQRHGRPGRSHRCRLCRQVHHKECAHLRAVQS